MKKLVLFFIALSLCCLPFLLPKEKNTHYLVLNKLEGAGMFACFNAVLGLLDYYEEKNCEGLKIDFEKNGLYYEEKEGPNFWQYYFEPIFLCDDPKAKEQKIIDQPGCWRENKEFNASFLSTRGWHLEKMRAAYLIDKYIRVKPHLIQKVDDFAKEHFQDYFIVGIHYRGTDKSLESARIDYENVVSELEKIIKDKKQYRIFVATDEEAFLQLMCTRYPKKVLFLEAIRSQDQKPIHTGSENKYRLGQEAVMDCLLLSRCHFLLRTDSCLSITSARFNPRMPDLLIK